MKMHIAAVMAAALLALPHGAMAQSGTLERIESSGKMRIGYRESEPPMSFAENGGQPVGYTIDICMRIATAVKEKLGRPDITVDFVPVTAADRFTALTDDQIDILCGSTTKTLSRSELVDFTQLTFVTGASLLSLDDARVESIPDLQGKKVGVVHDTTTIDVLENVLQGALIEAEVVAVDSAADAVRALREGEIDAFSSDQVVLVGLVLTSTEPGNFFVSSELFSFEPFALAVKRNDADFRLVADRVLSHLNRTGQIGDIYDKWFGKVAKEISPALRAVYSLNSTPE